MGLRKRNKVNVMTNVDVKEICNLYCSLDIFRAAKLRRVKGAADSMNELTGTVRRKHLFSTLGVKG
jgi:hypothetical protein